MKEIDLNNIIFFWIGELIVEKFSFSHFLTIDLIILRTLLGTSYHYNSTYHFNENNKKRNI